MSSQISFSMNQTPNGFLVQKQEQDNESDLSDTKEHGLFAAGSLDTDKQSEDLPERLIPLLYAHLQRFNLVMNADNLEFIRLARIKASKDKRALSTNMTKG